VNPIVMIAPTTAQTRLLMKYRGQEVMRALLPSPLLLHPKAASTLLEGLSLWLQQRLSVVLCADERDGSSLGLCDEGLALPVANLFYEVGVAPIDSRRTTSRQRLGGPSSFRDLERMSLWEVLP